MSGGIFGLSSVGGGATGIWWVGARGAADIPRHTGRPPTENCVTSAEVEDPDLQQRPKWGPGGGGYRQHHPGTR